MRKLFWFAVLAVGVAMTSAAGAAGVVLIERAS